MGAERGNIEFALEYVKRIYGEVTPERRAEIDREKAEREERARSMRPRLDAAIDAYWRIAEEGGVVGDVAHLHAPRHHLPTSPVAHCEGCDLEGMDPDYPRWPCTTARSIAEAHGINLDGIDTYKWDPA